MKPITAAEALERAAGELDKLADNAERKASADRRPTAAAIGNAQAGALRIAAKVVRLEKLRSNP